MLQSNRRFPGKSAAKDFTKNFQFRETFWEENLSTIVKGPKEKDLFRQPFPTAPAVLGNAVGNRFFLCFGNYSATKE